MTSGNTGGATTAPSSAQIRSKSPRSGPGGNVAWEGAVERGDVDGAFAGDDVVIVEGEYRAPRQNQGYIETFHRREVCVALPRWANAK